MTIKNNFINQKRAYIIYVFLTIAVFVFTSQIYSIFKDKSEYKGHYHGDLFTEIGNYISGLNFSKWGFSSLYFLPTNTYKETFAISEEDFYTHYPPGPDIVSGILCEIGVTNFYSQKFILLLVSIIALLPCAISAKYIVKGDRKSPVSPIIFLSIALTSPWFIYWAGNLNGNTYWLIFASIGVWAIVTDKLLLYVIICFFSLLFTPEIAPFLFVMAFFRAIRGIFLEKWTKKQGFYFLLIVCIALFFSFAIHFLQNAWMYHSIKLAYDDIIAGFLHRIGSEGDYSFFKHVTKVGYAILWFYGSSVLLLAVIGFFMGFRRISMWIYALIASGFIWQLLFREHNMIHAWTSRHLGIGIIMLVVVGFCELFYNKNNWSKITACILLGFSLLRLPLGAEVSKNQFLLNIFTNVVSKTDSAIIGNLLYFFKDTLEHREEKYILIKELAKRNNVRTDQNSYEFVLDDKSFILARIPRGYSIYMKNIPIGISPKFSEKELSAYVSSTNTCFGGYVLDNYTREKIVVKGVVNKMKYNYLKVYILLQ